MPAKKSAFRPFEDLTVGTLAIFSVGAILGGCSLPEYRLLVSQIPSASQKLEVAAYLPEVAGQKSALPTEHITADVKSGSTSMTLTVNLQGAYEKPKEAMFAAVARDSQGCVVGFGSSLPSEPSSVVADVELGLMVPNTPSSSQERCSAQGPIISDVLRQERGHYGESDFRFVVRGWNLEPNDQWIAKSKYVINSRLCTLKSCQDICRDTVACKDDAGAPATCRTGCQLVVLPEYVNPGITILHIPESENIIVDFAGGRTAIKDVTSLSGMRASPFEITLNRPTTSQTARYIEPSK